MSKHRLQSAFCNACGKPFRFRYCDLKRGRGRFCGLHCSRTVAGLRSISRNSGPLRKLLFEIPRNQRPIRILCVCVANQNRSPLVHICLEHFIKKGGLKKLVVVESGGLMNVVDEVLTPNFALPVVLCTIGIDSNLMIPKGITDGQLKKAHLILTADEIVTYQTIERLSNLYPNNSRVLRKIIPLASLCPRLFGNGKNVPDSGGDGIRLLELATKIKAVVRQKIIPILRAVLYQ